MSLNAHIFLDGKLYVQTILNNLPRLGDTIRVDDGIYAKVIEVIWCFDEDNTLYDRVNLRLETEQSCKN